jgi:hypothetical protein
MLLSESQNRFVVTAVLCVLAAVALSCRKAESRPIHVSLCEIYRNPAAYDGKLVTITATITQLPNGKYLYPGASRDCSYSFITVDPNSAPNNSLTQLESSTTPSNGRKEFDLEVTGEFDAKYSEGWDAFRYRLFPTHIKALSPVRTGKPLGAASKSNRCTRAAGACLS